MPSNLWNRVVQNTSSLTTNLSSLSLSNDSDGKTPHETLVHKALLNFYERRGGGQYPDWLVEGDPNFNGNLDHVQTVNVPTNNRFYPVSGNQYAVQNQSCSSGASGAGDAHSQSDAQGQPDYGASGYGRRQHQSARTQTPASAGLYDVYKSSRNSTASTMSSGSGASASRPNPLRDRLKGGQRSNYGSSSPSTASRLQSSWAKR